MMNSQTENGSEEEEIVGDKYFQVKLVDFHDTPSRRDKLDEQTENMLRLYGCELIQRAGILLKWYFILLYIIILTKSK